MYCIWDYVKKTMVQLVPQVNITLARNSRIFVTTMIICMKNWLKFTSWLPITSREWCEETECQEIGFFRSEIYEIGVFSALNLDRRFRNGTSLYHSNCTIVLYLWFDNANCTIVYGTIIVFACTHTSLGFNWFCDVQVKNSVWFAIIFYGSSG